MDSQKLKAHMDVQSAVWSPPQRHFIDPFILVRVNLVKFINPPNPSPGIVPPQTPTHRPATRSRKQRNGRSPLPHPRPDQAVVLGPDLDGRSSRSMVEEPRRAPPRWPRAAQSTQQRPGEPSCGVRGPPIGRGVLGTLHIWMRNGGTS